MERQPQTQDKLRDELKRLGFETSGRALTDWRSKKLLPRMSDLSRGRARGKLYRWRQPGIFRQALIVARMRALNYPTSELRVLVWLLGFSVESGAARAAWLTRLGRLELSMRKRDRFDQRERLSETEAEDAASAAASPVIAFAVKRFGIPREAIEQLLIDIAAGCPEEC